MSHNPRQGLPWYRWYAESDGPKERRLLLKLDLLIIPYAFIAFWLEYIDSTNISNAYVSGLARDLDFHGNELVRFQTIFTVGAVLGQLPFALLFPLFPMNYLVPGMEIAWGIFTLLQYRGNSFAEFMAYRFFVGFFSSAFFPGVHYVLGAWYRRDELARRGGIFYVGLTFGGVTASLIQSGASKHLDGVSGLAGWRWMFIIVAVMTLPVGIAGVFIWPGTPAMPNKLILTAEDLTLARKRLSDTNHSVVEGQGLRPSLQIFKDIFTDSKIYYLTFWASLFWNAAAAVNGQFLLWLQSLDRYSESRINSLGALAPGLGMAWILLVNFSSDLVLRPPGAITMALTVNIIVCIILAIWDVPDSAKWFAFCMSYFELGVSSVLYGWTNDILRHDNQRRALTLVLMNAVAQSTTGWTPLLVWKTVEAPQFLKGYTFTAVDSFCLICFTWVVFFLHRRSERKYALEHPRSSSVDGGESASPEQVDPRKAEGAVSVVPLSTE
ncbi:hypothetical protein A1O3_04353 [Capronia epimyces CBS 606.96]|uniref:Major facilitator superfamily (MFS) profile domain-containing protein n=1 Tax=Capronia epimyces CBS 606.96 TaxID=1182542 RepID=W9YYN6_9EURO|nr:uncharacterized protein A1O3_04353 [Capronia epimyces CBS 606.96]EXJ87394.1 hypothetical protein A1O3_04353 [Capronia epimyces CBS 606.96]